MQSASKDIGNRGISTGSFESFPNHPCPMVTQKPANPKIFITTKTLSLRLIILVAILSVTILSAGGSSNISSCSAQQAIPEMDAQKQETGIFKTSEELPLKKDPCAAYSESQETLERFI